MNVITAGRCTLALVDYQGRLMPVIHAADRITEMAVLLARGARLLGVPVVGTEQNPASLGPIVKAVREVCDQTIAKTHFDACADGLVAHLDRIRPGGDQVVVAGCEAHVCLLQTALGLMRAGRRVWVVENASGSRHSADHRSAMRRLATAGATIVTHEMVLFEWLHDCRHPQFKTVLALIKGVDHP